MKYDEALAICTERIKWAGNLYGNKWKEEEPFLKACQEALIEADWLQEKDTKNLLPEDGNEVLVLFDGISTNKLGQVSTFTNCTCIGAYYQESGWQLDHLPDLDDFTVKKWRNIPEWEEVKPWQMTKER